MPEASPRLHLPYLAVGQAQKEVTHNEALARLDICVQAAVEDVLSAPPQAPEVGQCWLVGDNPQTAWTGRAGAIAQWTEGGWRFVEPFEGMTLWQRAASVRFVRESGTWSGAARVTSVRIAGKQVVGPQLGAISLPSGGNVADVEARTSIASIIAALQAHGLISD